MYFMYAQMSIGIYPSWKKYMTTAQIIQFVWGLTSFWPAPFACGFDLWSIEGPMLPIWFNQFVMISFLALFLNFYFKRYAKKDKTE